MNAAARLHQLGQSLWLDNITREILDKGTLADYIANASVTGLTSNPTIFDEAIGGTADYDADIRRLASAGLDPEAIFAELALADLRRAADLFRPVFDATQGLDGWVSMEVSPLLAANTVGSVQAAEKIHAAADRPNLFVKIPGTTQGLQAIEESIFAGIPVNVTLLFSRDQYVAAAEAYLRGIERRIAAGLPARVASVASVFISRWDKAVADKAPAELRNRLGIAVAQQAYRAYLELFDSPRWRPLADAGAQRQRLLWASTGSKDPNAPDTLYVEALAAPDTINTIPEKTLKAWLDHGKVGAAMAIDGDAGAATLRRFSEAGIDVDALAAQLQDEGAKSFVKSWTALLARIASKGQSLAGAA